MKLQDRSKNNNSVEEKRDACMQEFDRFVVYQEMKKHEQVMT
jgi:hypothetical protein